MVYSNITGTVTGAEYTTEGINHNEGVSIDVSLLLCTVSELRLNKRYQKSFSNNEKEKISKILDNLLDICLDATDVSDANDE